MGYKIVEPTEQFDVSRRRLFHVLCINCGRGFLKPKHLAERDGAGCIDCANKTKRTATTESVQKNSWSHFLRQCKVRKKENQITYEQWLELSEQPCFYCGEEYSNTKSLGHRRQILWHCNGIDRVDSNGPYSEENCVPCCQWCNSGKKEQTPEEFIDRCKRVAQMFT